MNPDDYLFHQTEDGPFVRKCFGMEWLTGCTSEYLDGMTHLTLTVAVRLLNSLSEDQVKQGCKDAWIRLRYKLPGMACRSSSANDPEKHYTLRYIIPRSDEDLTSWVSETIFFSERVDALEKLHMDLKDHHWWKQSENRYVTELHVSPLLGANEWRFSISSVHNSADGRSVFQVLQLYLDCLTVVLDVGPPALTWGDEVCRLPPPASFLSSIVSHGFPPSLAIDRPSSQDSSSPAPNLWLYPLLPTNAVGDLTRFIRFSQEDTKKIHALAKANGKTVTQVMTAFTTIAYAEAAFRTASKAGCARFQEIWSSYEKATHFPIILNFINHRHKLPGGYSSFESPSSSPLVAYDGVQLFTLLEGVKRLLSIDSSKLSVTRIVDQEAFWNVLVNQVAKDWANVDTSLEAFYKRDLALHMGLEHDGFNTGTFNAPFAIVSSIGDMGRLGILNAYLPSAGGEKRLTITDLIFGIRLRIPNFSNMVHQFNEEMTCTLCIASEYTTPEAFQDMTDAFLGWIKAIIH